MIGRSTSFFGLDDLIYIHDVILRALAAELTCYSVAEGFNSQTLVQAFIICGFDCTDVVTQSLVCSIAGILVQRASACSRCRLRRFIVTGITAERLRSSYVLYTSRQCIDSVLPR